LAIHSVWATPGLPNDAKYFWCSELYDPVYPLNPTNLTIPLRNNTHFNPANYPQPDFKVSGSLSLYTFETEVELLVWAGKDLCSSCSSVYFLATSGTTSVDQTISLGEESSVSLAADELSLNQATEFSCSVFTSQGGSLLATQSVVLRRYSPNKQEVKIDYRSKGLIVEGNAWIPMGFYLPWDAKFSPFAAYEVRNGMQTPLPYRPEVPPSAEFLSFLDQANAMGTRVHFDIYELSQQPNSPEKWQTLNATIQVMKNQDGFLAYYIADEPDGAGFGLDPSLLREVYEFIKEQDPYHPVTLVLNCVNSAPTYVNCADILMADPYPIGLSQPVGCADCIGQPIDVPTRMSEILLEINSTKPLWAVVQAFGGPNEHWNREPTWQEIRAMSYLAIIRGATGIQYFLEGLPYSRATWAECRKVALEIQSLAPLILSHVKEQVISDSEQVYTMGYNQSSQGGVMLILVANSLNTPVKFALTIPSLQGFHHLESTVLFENRNQPVNGGQIEDHLNGWATRAYRISFNSQSPDRSNLIINPSFESQANVGMADGMWPELNGTLNSALVDPNYAHEGLFSQRLTNVNGNQQALQVYKVSVPSGIQYEFSFYAMSNAEGYPVQFWTNCLQSESNFVISSPYEWQSFSTTILLTKPTVCKFSLIIETPGSVWFDSLWLGEK